MNTLNRYPAANIFDRIHGFPMSGKNPVIGNLRVVRKTFELKYYL
jgi:hypothetical protein